jgi:hypothetical protein
MNISTIVPGIAPREINDAAWSGAVRTTLRVAGALRLMLGREARTRSTLGLKRYVALAGDGFMPDMMPFLAPEGAQRVQNGIDLLGTDEATL